MRKKLYYFLFFLLVSINLFSKPPCLVLIGAPGSGKGTQASIIKKEFSYAHICAGDLLRDQISKKTDIAIQIDSLISQGLLVPDELILNMLLKRIRMQDCDKGLIIDGSSRNLNQARFLYDNLQEKYDIIALIFSIDRGVVLERNLNRIICQNCNEIYNLKYFPPNEFMICDVCNVFLSFRKDDKKEVILKRFDQFNEQLLIMENFYKEKENVFYINANRDKNIIFDDIKNIINSKIILQ